MKPGPNEVYGALHARFPFDSAYDWDNSGWQIQGTREVGRCLVALDPTPEAIKQALEWEADLIVTHHPLFFPHVRSIQPGSIQGAVLKVLLDAEIGLIASHTCADRHLDGISGALADELGLRDQQILAPDAEQPYFKLVTFVPDDSLVDVRSALSAAGAGVIGNYVECSFSLAGIGTYQPQKGAKPITGQIGELEQADEQRLEMRVPERALESVLEALRRSHPYDEVAYDLFRSHHQGAYLGIGVLGQLKKPTELDEVLIQVKEALGGVHLVVSGPAEGMVHTLAVVAGSADEFVPVAAARGADLFVGGDLKYHARLESAHQMVSADPGHRATEQPGVRRLASVLKSATARNGWETEVEVFVEPPSLDRII